MAITSATDNNLEGIRHKLLELPTAVMYNLSSHPYKLPNDIAQFLRVDEEGKLWFSIHPPRQSLFTFEQSFPAHFCFYSKGANYYASADGIACIIKWECEAENAIMIRLTPSIIEFNETKANGWNAALQKWWGVIKEKLRFDQFKNNKEYGY